MKLRAVSWENDKMRIIDQTRLSAKLEYVDISRLRQLWEAVRSLKVRGAPALGAAAGLGVYLGIRGYRGMGCRGFVKKFDQVAAYLASARPTARNLFYGLERMRATLEKNKSLSLDRLKKALLKEALAIVEEDRSSCRSIARHGWHLIKDGDTVLTICNAGILATIDYGTALGVLYRAREEGRDFQVFSCETRPLLQGSRLTAWELHRAGIDVTLICDNTAASLMQKGRVNKVIAGADRIAANGDAANKIGTFNLAVLARYHRIPFYIAAPASTFDLGIKNGSGIAIEERPAGEVAAIGGRETAPKGVKVFNPAFDVTPHGLITAIITDKGVISRPSRRNVAGLMKR